MAFHRAEKIAVLAKLAGGDASAGILLNEICKRYAYAKITIKGREGRWSVDPHRVWSNATGLSPDKVKRTLQKLATLSEPLIERDYRSWNGCPNVLHVRPTQRTLDTLEAITTVRAMQELLGGAKGPVKALLGVWKRETGADIDTTACGRLCLWLEDLTTKSILEQLPFDGSGLRDRSHEILAHTLRQAKGQVPQDDEGIHELLWRGVEAWHAAGRPALTSALNHHGGHDPMSADLSPS
jgi:hypothetical protein